jgi:hypothetical protein
MGWIFFLLFCFLFLSLFFFSRSIEKVAYELFVAGIGKLESERDKHGDHDNDEQSETDIKNIMKTVSPNNHDTSGKSAIGPTSLADLQLSIFAEMENMSVDDIWGVFKVPNCFGEARGPFDFFPVSCVAFCEIYRIGNAIKQVNKLEFVC